MSTQPIWSSDAIIGGAETEIIGAETEIVVEVEHGQAASREAIIQAAIAATGLTDLTVEAVATSEPREGMTQITSVWLTRVSA